RWTISIPESYYLFAPLVRGRTVLLQGKAYIAIDARTGKELWRHDGECCTALASPDGRELYVRGEVGVADRLDWSGRLRARLPGELAAVSDGWVALQEEGRFAVHRHGARDATWSQPTSNHVYVAAVTLSGDDLFYFSSADSTLWRRNLATGRARAIRAAHSRVVISTDASGVAPAHIGAAPIVAGPYVFVLDWAIHAYRLGAP
ncbi:MAG TPA: PQQ-binding-like beta-propeller repeat protein, partial [Kofleriaceae bacterium]|nr:PQQ-binding-like beta-propeller repeat protein [Kofleriaceae bacterium]